jgi:hypothetical protein
MVLSCRSAVAHLDEHEEGQGPWLARAGLRLHLALCQPCFRYLGQLRAVREALRALQPEPVSPETRDRLLACFRTWRDRRQKAGG